MERAHGDAVERPPLAEMLDAGAHLPGRLVGEGHGQDAVAGDVLDLHQVGDAVGEHARLARPGSGDDEHGSVGREHGFALRVVQPGEKFGCDGGRDRIQGRRSAPRGLETRNGGAEKSSIEARRILPAGRSRTGAFDALKPIRVPFSPRFADVAQRQSKGLISPWPVVRFHPSAPGEPHEKRHTRRSIRERGAFYEVARPNAPANAGRVRAAPAGPRARRWVHVPLIGSSSDSPAAATRSRSPPRCGGFRRRSASSRCSSTSTTGCGHHPAKKRREPQAWPNRSTWSFRSLRSRRRRPTCILG